MKCIKCGEEQVLRPNSRNYFCSKCGSPLSTDSNITSTNVLKRLIQRYPEENILLFSPNRLFGMITDELGNADPALVKRLQIAITIENVPRKINDLLRKSEQEQIFLLDNLLNSLKIDYGEKIAIDIVAFFADALGLNTNPIKIKIKVNELISLGNMEWRVLDIINGQALIISEKILEDREFHDETNDVTWAGSKLRKYLNSDFFNKFNIQEQFLILETKVTNNDNEWFSTLGGIDTTDKIFLLNINEVVSYFHVSWGSENIKPVTELDKLKAKRNINNLYKSSGTPKWWWLRSKGSCNYEMNGVYYHPIQGNLFGCYKPNLPGGVRPAMFIKVNN